MVEEAGINNQSLLGKAMINLAKGFAGPHRKDDTIPGVLPEVNTIIDGPGGRQGAKETEDQKPTQQIFHMIINRVKSESGPLRDI